MALARSESARAISGLVARVYVASALLVGLARGTATLHPVPTPAPPPRECITRTSMIPPPGCSLFIRLSALGLALACFDPLPAHFPFACTVSTPRSPNATLAARFPPSCPPSAPVLARLRWPFRPVFCTACPHSPSRVRRFLLTRAYAPSTAHESATRASTRTHATARVSPALARSLCLWHVRSSLP